MDDHGPELALLLSGFRRGAGFGALAGFLAYAAVLLAMNPAAAGSLLGVAAGMIAALVGGAFVGGLIGAYVNLARRTRRY